MNYKLKNVVKYCRPIFKVYNKVGGYLIRTIGHFIPMDDKLILFVSYGGRRYDDSPKCLYEKMKDDIRFRDYKFLWAFDNPARYPGILSVKIDTFDYFIKALKAKVWITNSAIERGLQFKKESNIYVNTWHGTPIKRMGADLPVNNQSFSSNLNNMNMFLVQGDYEKKIFSRAFDIKDDVFLKVGLPRNDVLVAAKTLDKQLARKKLNIKSDTFVILYMPTFREFVRNSITGCAFDFKLNPDKWINKLKKNDFVFLYRAHYEISTKCNGKGNEYFRNVSNYEELNDLLIASDVLISDYSSVIFDYSLLEKPVILYLYDYKSYESKRGLYFDIRSFFKNCDNEDDLLIILNKMDYKEESIATSKFKNRFLNYYGNASDKTIDKLYELLYR